MVIYGLILSVLAEHIRMDLPGFIQFWYADDFRKAGAGANLLPAISGIEELGTTCAFYLVSENHNF